MTDEEDDEIIINDEYSEEDGFINPISINHMKSNNLSEQVTRIEINEQVAPPIRPIPSQTNQRNAALLKPNQSNHNIINTRDIDAELPCRSTLVYQEKETSLEEEYIKKIKSLTKDNEKLKEDNNKLLNEMKVFNKEFEAKAINKTIQEKKKINKNEMNLAPLHSQLKVKDNKIAQLEEYSKSLTQQIDNYKIEYDKLRNDLNNKEQRIRDLDDKIAQKENELNNHDNKEPDYNEDMGISIEALDEYTQHLAKVENQLSIAIDQIQQLTNENYHLKQTMLKLNPTVSSNNHLNINDNDHTLVTNKSSSRLKGSKVSNSDQSNTLKHSKSNSELKHLNSKDNIGNVSPIKSNYTHQKQKPSILEHSPYVPPVIPNQFDIAMKESKILDIETTLYKLQKERDKLNDELTRLPEFPKQRNQINKKNSLEASINDFNTKINSNKLKLRELNKPIDY